MNNCINNFLVTADKVCDYIPGVSTVNNLIDLFQKCVFVDSLNKQTSRYYKHLHYKEFSRCVTLLIPVLGNIIIAISDMIDSPYYNKESLLKLVTKNGLYFEYAPREFREDKEIAIAALTGDEQAFQFVSKELQDDEDVVIAALNSKNCFDPHSLIMKTSMKIRDNKKVMMVAVAKWGNLLQFASERLQNDEEVEALAVEKNGESLLYAKSLRKNKQTVIDLINKKGGWMVRYCDRSLLCDEDVVKAVLAEENAEKFGDGSTFGSFEANIRNNEDFALTAIERSASAYSYVGSKLNTLEFLKKAFKRNIKVVYYCPVVLKHFLTSEQ